MHCWNFFMTWRLNVSVFIPNIHCLGHLLLPSLKPHEKLTPGPSLTAKIVYKCLSLQAQHCKQIELFEPTTAAATATTRATWMMTTEARGSLCFAALCGGVEPPLKAVYRVPSRFPNCQAITSWWCPQGEPHHNIAWQTEIIYKKCNVGYFLSRRNNSKLWILRFQCSRSLRDIFTLFLLDWTGAHCCRLLLVTCYCVATDLIKCCLRIHCFGKCWFFFYIRINTFKKICGFL